MSSADAIARAVNLIRGGHVVAPPNAIETDEWQSLVDLLTTSTVVDVTPVYDALLKRDEGVLIYEDHEIRPPWLDAVICWQTEHVEAPVVFLSHVVYVPVADIEPELLWQPGDLGSTARDIDGNDALADEPLHSIDWDEVGWVALHLIYVAVLDGRAVMGPMHGIRYAVNNDGSIADIRWQKYLPDVPDNLWDNSLLTVLQTLTFLNCRNVTIVDPHRPRPERRRLARVDVTVHTLTITPHGTTVRGKRAEPGVGVPLTTVRGHVAKYGPRYGRGLLFGRIEGAFWIGEHERGDAALGVSEHDYRIEVP